MGPTSSRQKGVSGLHLGLAACVTTCCVLSLRARGPVVLQEAHLNTRYSDVYNRLFSRGYRACICLSSGVCLVCGKKLEDDPGLSREQHHHLHSFIKQLLEKGTDRFHDNTQAVKEVETFCAMMASEGPFTAVIDGLNVAAGQGASRMVRQVHRQ